MDSVPGIPLMHIDCGNIRLDGDVPRTPDGVLLRVVGDISISVGGQEVYAETDFCLVEFAYHLSEWLTNRARHDQWVYVSMEADQPLVWFTPRNGAWMVGVDHPRTVIEEPIPDDDLRAAVDRYIDQVIADVRQVLEIDVGELIRTTNDRDGV